jgi:hypothetical protein
MAGGNPFHPKPAGVGQQDFVMKENLEATKRVTSITQNLTQVFSHLLDSIKRLTSMLPKAFFGALMHGGATGQLPLNITRMLTSYGSPVAGGGRGLGNAARMFIGNLGNASVGINPDGSTYIEPNAAQVGAAAPTQPSMGPPPNTPFGNGGNGGGPRYPGGPTGGGWDFSGFQWRQNAGILGKNIAYAFAKNSVGYFRTFMRGYKGALDPEGNAPAHSLASMRWHEGIPRALGSTFLGSTAVAAGMTHMAAPDAFKTLFDNARLAIAKSGKEFAEPAWGLTKRVKGAGDWFGRRSETSKSLMANAVVGTAVITGLILVTSKLAAAMSAAAMAARRFAAAGGMGATTGGTRAFIGAGIGMVGGGLAGSHFGGSIGRAVGGDKGQMVGSEIGAVAGGTAGTFLGMKAMRKGGWGGIGRGAARAGPWAALAAVGIDGVSDLASSKRPDSGIMDLFLSEFKGPLDARRTNRIHDLIGTTDAYGRRISVSDTLHPSLKEEYKNLGTYSDATTADFVKRSRWAYGADARARHNPLAPIVGFFDSDAERYMRGATFEDANAGGISSYSGTLGNIGVALKSIFSSDFRERAAKSGKRFGEASDVPDLSIRGVDPQFMGIEDMWKNIQMSVLSPPIEQQIEKEQLEALNKLVDLQANENQHLGVIAR